MPVIKRKPTVSPSIPQVQIAKPDYKSIQVDTRINTKENIVAQLEGAPWHLERYYSQILNRDSGPAGQSLGAPAVLQQYRLIYDMEIRVQDTLSDSQNQTTKEMETTGRAYTYAFIIPNKGDMFVAELLDGRLGYFEVISTNRPTIEADASYEMSYMLVGIDDKVREADLKSKTQTEVHFEKDFIIHGQNPLLTSSDYEAYSFIRRQYHILVRRFFERFISREHATLIVPDQGDSVYDHFVTKAMYRIIDTTEDYRIRDVRRMNMDDDQLMGSRSVWDVLIERERSMFNDIFTKAGLAATNRFDRFPRHDGIRFSGIKNVVYPSDAVLRVDNQLTQEPKGTGDYDPYANSAARDKTVLGYMDKNKLSLPDSKGRKIFPALMSGGCYVFSDAFYEDRRTAANEQSQLELVLQDLIDENHIEFTRIKELIEHSVSLKDVEQFYFIPALLIIIRGAIRSI